MRTDLRYNRRHSLRWGRVCLSATEATIAVRLRVAPTLRHSLSAFAGAKEIEVRLAPGARVHDLAASVGLDMAQLGLVCVLNGQIAAAEATLQQGDEVRLLHRLAGG